MHRTEGRAVFPDSGEHGFEAQRFGMEHGAAAITREAIAAGPNNIDIGRAQSDAFFKCPEALVDQGIDAALDDLFRAVMALRNLELGCSCA